jgi:hypothetical protein
MRRKKDVQAAPAIPPPLTPIGKYPMEREATQDEVDQFMVRVRCKQFLRELIKKMPEKQFKPILFKYLEQRLKCSIKSNGTAKTDPSVDDARMGDSIK